jgi:hypothetical protein
LLGKAFATVNRAVVPGTERNLAGCSAGSADSVKHFTLGFSGVFAGIAAVLAACGFISESFFSEEVLFTCGEYEFLSAVSACQGFVFVKQLKYLVFKIYA